MRDSPFGQMNLACELSRATLQVHDKLVTKTIQLFETFMVRFGVMLVGPTLGGKTAGNLRVEWSTGAAERSNG